MKRTLFIMTHLGSDWEELVEVINKKQNFQCFNTNNSYKHHDDVKSLTLLPHRINNSVSVWCDTIFHNKDFAMKFSCKYYKFIFWVGLRQKSIDDLISIYGYGPDQAENYYDYRLVGLSQYYNRCPNSLLNPNLKNDSFLSAIF